MWKKQPVRLGWVVLVELWLVLVVHTLPVYDAGPHVQNGWGESIRIRRLRTVRKNGLEDYFLRIQDDGRVDAEKHHSCHSLLEIRTVDIGLVVFKGHHSSLYLCMASDGTLYGKNNYSPEDCSFKEEILRDKCSMYTSPKHGVPVSLSKDKQRQQSKGKGQLPLSHFVPVMYGTSADLVKCAEEPNESHHDGDIRNSHNVESMDPLRLTE